MDSIPAHEVSEVPFDETVDVVVVGLGVAGTSAVVAARQAGAEVLAVEHGPHQVARRPTRADSSTWEAGRLCRRPAATRTRRKTWQCSFDAALGPGADDDRVDAYCEGSPDHFDWLVSIGVPFRAAFCDEPNRESADDAGLLFSGGEDSYPFDEIAVPVPRGHKPQWIDSAGGFLMERLGAAVAASSARMMAGTRAEALVVDGGDVVGVQVRTDEGARAIRARGGVILAAGGFISNEAMVAEQCPSAHVPDSAWRIGTPNDDGRGIRMGVGAGAATTRLSSFECALPLGPPHRLARGILVNRHGERFINEDAYTGRIGLHALRDQDGFVYMITDDVIHERNLLGLRVGFAAATPEELAVDLGVPPDALARTVRDYNEAAAQARIPSSTSARRSCNPSAYHRRAASVPLTCASTTVPSTRPSPLAVSSPTPTGQRSTAPVRRISGLYAVGRTAASLAASHYASGISLGDGSFFGRRAGRHAATRAGDAVSAAT